MHRVGTTWVSARGKWRPPNATYPLKNRLKMVKNLLGRQIYWRPQCRGAWEPLTPL